MISHKALRERFSQIDVGKWLRLCRGLAILAATLLLASYIANYVINEKMIMVYELEGFESLTPALPDFESVVAALGIKLGITLALIMMIMLLIVMFKGESLNFVRLLTLVAHSFMIVALFMLLQVPFIWQVPKVSYMIVNASFDNITFREATLIGITPEGSVSITSPIVKASYARVYRAYSNLTIPNWEALDPERVREVIESTRTYMNLTSVSWLSGGEEMVSERLDFCVGNWSAVEYQSLIEMLSVREQGIEFSEMMIDVLSIFSNIGQAAYNSVGFKRLYKVSTKLAIVVGAFLFLVLLFLKGGRPV